jgi:hypothetical protein
MKQLVRIHNWVVNNCASLCNRALGYNRVLDNFTGSGK